MALRQSDIENARWLAPASLVGALCLGAALQISNGFLHPAALCLVTISFAFLFLAAMLPRPEGWVRFDRRAVQLAGLVGLTLHVGYLATTSPGLYVRAGADDLVRFHWGLAVLSVVGGTAMAGRSRWLLVQITALVAAHFALGVWMIHRSPDPAIDVHVFHTHAISALRQGLNPYSITFPDIYGNGAFYGPGMSADGRLQFGFPYFPLSLLVAAPGQILGKDPRYAQLAAMELAALLMAFARPRGLGLVAAALYLTTPRSFFVLEQSWTEPFVVLGATMVVFASCRESRLLPWVFGAFIALKQYLVFALPGAVLLAGHQVGFRAVFRFLMKGAVVGGLITLPFVLWDPPAFVRSVVTLQFYQPFRGDALSYLAWWTARGHAQPSTLVSFAVATAAATLAVWRLPRTPAGFAAAMALTFFAFFAFNKQAFANYYFFVLGTMYATVAAWRPPETVV